MCRQKGVHVAVVVRPVLAIKVWTCQCRLEIFDSLACEERGRPQLRRDTADVVANAAGVDVTGSDWMLPRMRSREGVTKMIFDGNDGWKD